MEQYFTAISQTHYLLHRVFSFLLKKHSDIQINAGQMQLIMSLWDNDGLNVQQLAQQNCLKKSTVSTMLPKMIEAGMLTQKTSSDDHRQQIITLTEKGQNLKECHKDIYQTLDDEIFEGISEEEKQIFLGTIVKLKENLIKKEKKLASG